MYWRPDPSLYPRHLQARIARGLGVGEGVNYRGWRNIRDSGTGTSSFIEGIRTPRVFLFLNEKETTYFYLTERDPNKISIKEHWPILSLEETVVLCAKHGIRHPTRNHFPEPFVIDFLIAERCDDGIRYKAASINPINEPLSERTTLKLIVQQKWCEDHGIYWTRIDTTYFSKVVLQNLRFIRSWYRHRYVPNESIADHFSERFAILYRKNVILSRLIAMTGKQLRICEDTATDLFRYCAWSSRINISLRHSLLLDSPLILTNAGRDA